MATFWRAFRAELFKQHKESMKGKAVFFSLLLWPVLEFCSAFFAMKPYRAGAGSALTRWIPDGNLALFLLTGFLVFQLYWTVVQAAWTFEWERKGGTLEMVFLAPGSKLAFLYGRSFYSLLKGIWMFFVFCALTFFFFAEMDRIAWGYLALALVITLFSAVNWGAFLCAISLFSRDAGFLYYIFQAPMNLFGGVRIPLAAFPFWAKGLSFLFPVTYSLLLVRDAISGEIGTGWWWMAGLLFGISLLLVLVTQKILGVAERHAQVNGSWTLF